MWSIFPHACRPRGSTRRVCQRNSEDATTERAEGGKEIFALIGCPEGSGSAEDSNLHIAAAEHSGGVGGRTPYIRDLHQYIRAGGAAAAEEQVVEPYGPTIAKSGKWVSGWEKGMRWARREHQRVNQ